MDDQFGDNSLNYITHKYSFQIPIYLDISPTSYEIYPETLIWVDNETRRPIRQINRHNL